MNLEFVIDKNNELTIHPELHFHASSSSLWSPMKVPNGDVPDGSGQEVNDAAKKHILQQFICKLSLQNNEELGVWISESLLSPDGRKELYSVLSSSTYDRKRIYSRLYVSPEQVEQMESKWCLLHHQPQT